MDGLENNSLEVCRLEQYRMARENRRLTLRSRRITKAYTRQLFANLHRFTHILQQPGNRNRMCCGNTIGSAAMVDHAARAGKFKHARMFWRRKLDALRQKQPHRMDGRPDLHGTHETVTAPAPRTAPPQAQSCTCKACLESPLLNVNEPADFGEPGCICPYCGALFWYEERTKKTSTRATQYFSLCCMHGKAQLPALPHPPTELAQLLLNSTKTAKAFRKNIRRYNSMFAFTSMGGRIDNTINRTKGPYVFRLNGQNIHRIGSLLPIEGKQPAFAQLYIYDTENETSNRIRSIKGNVSDEGEVDIVHSLKNMLDNHNTLAKSFRCVRDRLASNPHCALRLRLKTERTIDGRIHAMPVASKVAGLIVGDLTIDNIERDIVVEHRSHGLQRINDLHPKFMSLTYPLLFPYGEDSYRLQILLKTLPHEARTRKTLTMCQYYCYRLQHRQHEGKTLLLGGCLFQQFVVDAYMTIEEERFRWIRNNQKTLRSELYNGLMDAVSKNDTERTKIGKFILLPSSHTGTPRFKVQNYQDAMAICRSVGYPDLFITFTCNPKWPEINNMISRVGHKSDENRVDVVCRVFKMKLKLLMDDLKNNKLFGRTQAVVYTIEFQKRGLPHAHILLFLHAEDKNHSAQHLDNIISAEIPDKTIDPAGYKAVQTFCWK